LTGTAVSVRFLDGISNGLSNGAGILEKTSAANGALLEGLTLWAEDAQAMRRDELKSGIILEWDRWLQSQPIGARRPTARDTLKFFCELQDRRSPLLEFRSGGRDKWQIIHAWLVGEGRVSEVVSLSPSPRRRGVAPPQPRAAQNKKHGDKCPT
jgi:hypothetical protein